MEKYWPDYIRLSHTQVIFTWNKDQKFWRPKLPQENAVFLCYALTASSLFFFRKIASKNIKFQEFLPLKKHFVATLRETSAIISRKYVVEQGMNFFQIFEKYFFFFKKQQFFRSPLLRYCLQKIRSNMPNVQTSLPLKKILVANLSETHAFISRKYVS